MQGRKYSFQRCGSLMAGTTIKESLSIMHKRDVLPFMLMLSLTLLCAGCATSYSVALRYRPQEPAKTNAPPQPDGMFSACIFSDMRAYLTSKRQVGLRITADGAEVPINSTALLPGYAVAEAIKACLFSRGCSVYGGLPAWNMQPESTERQWGRFAIGGIIDEFEARAWEDMGLTRYRTQIKLRVTVADVPGRRIIYKTVVDASTSLQHVYFSEALMQREINRALSAAIERFFNNPALHDALQQTRQVRVRPLEG